MQHEHTYHRQHLERRCVYQSCPADAVTFLSEDDFRTHMVDFHLVSLTGVSEILLMSKTCRRVVASRTDAHIDCPVCHLSIPNHRSKIGRHLGRHMEDIALPIMSLVVPTDEDTMLLTKATTSSVPSLVSQHRRRRHPSDLKTQWEESSASLSTFVHMECEYFLSFN
jgi:hypothetical protein